MARVIGINHVALEVGDIEEALKWYGRFFEFELRGHVGGRMAFLDMGDQFIALAVGPAGEPDATRHFGLVVDDKEGVRAAMREAGFVSARVRLAAELAGGDRSDYASRLAHILEAWT